MLKKEILKTPTHSRKFRETVGAPIASLKRQRQKMMSAGIFQSRPRNTQLDASQEGQRFECQRARQFFKQFRYFNEGPASANAIGCKIVDKLSCCTEAAIRQSGAKDFNLNSTIGL